MSAVPVLIDARAFRFLHDECLAMFGGGRGLRDAGLLESALTGPVNQHPDTPERDIAALAAAYASGLARNHPYVDGNQRTAFLALGLVLALNGLRLQTTQIDAIETMLSLARGGLEEGSLADWVREKMVRQKMK